ncbi:HNH endonuclease signature motif containing protein [Mesorhizobium captivum]|uniref:HNH endonuclease signature motif containing protein n=1 Tax=Mesorhizobium captivum TaxID=3072319 RepID=UPI002A247F59|nr:HNH endonuclease signature motif containing protein [Mesorhizobium sp. VK23E]MDX8514950.1 HNH endonuclease signature motif containing protein [Mesorhizobium sp. VK23E]
MVHIIPLSVGQRRLDTGNAVQYPGSSPVGEAMQQLGSEWQAAAERYEQRRAQQQAFDTEIAARRLNGELAQAEADAVANAPADGAGLHDAMYGQVNPHTGQVVKTGFFDTLFGNFLKQVPPDLRPGLASRKEALREAGSVRMAVQQNQRRKQYEQDQVSEAQTAELRNIAQSDPNDTAAFDASRRAGLDLLAKMDLDPQIRQQAEAAWRASTTRARLQALIALDPRRAAEMLSAGPVASDGMGETVRLQLGAGSQGEQEVAKGDRVGKLTPDERVAQAFGDSSSAPGKKGADLAADAHTDLSPDDVQRLIDQAHAATATQLIEARANIDLATENAPDAIANTGNYSGTMPSPADFVAVYGVEEGGKQFRDFSQKVDIGQSIFKMRHEPNQAIHAELRDFEPGPNGSPEERERYEIKAAAAQLVLAARRADPVGYVSRMFPNQAPDWEKVSTPEDYKAAITWSVAAQQEMGLDKILAVPQSSSDRLAAKFNDQSLPLQRRIGDLSAIFLVIRDPAVRLAMARQLFWSSLPQLYLNAANDPNITHAEVEAQVESLKAGLSAIAQNPALAQYDAAPIRLQLLAAADDIARLVADGGTFGHADKIAARIDSLIYGKDYRVLLPEERAKTQDASDRAGSAGTVAELLGAYLATRVLGGAGITLGGFGTAMEGLSGLLARSGLAGIEGAAYGAVDAAGHDEDIGSGAVSGGLWGAGSNFLMEAATAVRGELPGWLSGRSKSIRKKWELEYDQTWPKDPNTGRNMDGHHRRPRSEGGTDDPWNIEPLSKADHIKHHKEQGHFKMWGSWSRGKRGPKS